MKYVVWSLALTIVIFSCGQENRQTNIMKESFQGLITQEEWEDGWRPIFDGKSFKGWRSFLKQDINPGWYIEDNLIVTRGDSLIHPGDLITTEIYEDFELSVDWAICWQGNSGIFFHVQENSWAAWATGPEYALLDDEHLDNVNPKVSTGANYEVQAPINQKLQAQSAFNNSRIRIKDGVVTHWLNGIEVVVYELWTDEWEESVRDSKWKDYPLYGRALNGHIGFQGHGFESKFKNIKVRDLTELGKSISLPKKEQKKELLSCDIESIDFSRDFIFRMDVLCNNDDPLIICFSTEIEENRNFVNELMETSVRSENEKVVLKIADSDTIPLKIGTWNNIVVRYKNEKLIVWLNSQMILKESLQMNFDNASVLTILNPKIYKFEKLFFNQL